MEASIAAYTVTTSIAVASGVWGLVMGWRAQNEKKKEPNPWRFDPQLTAKLDPEQMKKWDLAIEAMQAKPPVFTPIPEPADRAPDGWHERVIEHSDHGFEVMNESLQAILDTVEQQKPVNLTGLERKIEGLAKLVAEAVDPLINLPSKLGKAIEKIHIPAPVVSVSGGGGGGGGGRPPRRLPPPPSPRDLPFNPVATPSIPASYVGGTVIVPEGQAVSLLALIQQQLTLACPGSSLELRLSADQTIFVGSASNIGGQLTDTNYAYELAPGDPPRIYRSSFPGHSTPIGDLEVFANGAASLHVEVVT